MVTTVLTHNSLPNMGSETRSNDVFISYSRKDKEFVRQLDAAFRSANRDPWVDWKDIQPSEDWWQAIEAGIEAADTFIFVISPDSVNSQVCRREVDHAVRHNKRLLPIVRREGFAPEAVHPSLSRHNWLFFRESDGFDQPFQLLVKVLDTDLEYVHTHTRLLVRAIEWNKKGHNDSYLLRGSDLEEAEQWLAQSASKQPQPTQLQGEYITTSRKVETLRQKAEIKQQRLVTAMISAFALLSVGAAISTFIQWQAADRLSEQNRVLAEKNSLLATLPNQYEQILHNQIQFLETRVERAARQGRSARSVLIEIQRSQAANAATYANLKQTATRLMQEWLEAKQEIFAAPFNTQRLEELTTGARLERAKLEVEGLKVNHAHYKYGESKLGEVEILNVDGNQIACEAEETETVAYYINGQQQPTDQRSTRRTRYIMTKVNGHWKISDSQTINQ